MLAKHSYRVTIRRKFFNFKKSLNQTFFNKKRCVVFSIFQFLLKEISRTTGLFSIADTSGLNISSISQLIAASNPQSMLRLESILTFGAVTVNETGLIQHINSGAQTSARFTLRQVILLFLCRPMLINSRNAAILLNFLRPPATAPNSLLHIPL